MEDISQNIFLVDEKQLIKLPSVHEYKTLSSMMQIPWSENYKALQFQWTVIIFWEPLLLVAILL